MYIYVYLCISMYIYVYLCISMHIYVYLCISMYMYVCLCICMYVYVYVCICMYIYVCLCISMYIYAYLCICMYMYVYVCTCMYMYVTCKIKKHETNNQTICQTNPTTSVFGELQHLKHAHSTWQIVGVNQDMCVSHAETVRHHQLTWSNWPPWTASF